MMTAQFQKVDPNVKGPITLEESVKLQLEVIGRLDEKMSGSFVSQHGNRDWF